MGSKKKPINKKNAKEFKKLPLNRAFTKLLDPTSFCTLNYTPEELRLKFTQYVERSDKNGEEITISGFSVFSDTDRHFLHENKKSKSFSAIVKKIYGVFENRYEQRIVRGENLAYLMNNRFKGERETATKNEDKVTIQGDVKDSLDYVLTKNKKK